MQQKLNISFESNPFTSRGRGTLAYKNVVDAVINSEDACFKLTLHVQGKANHRHTTNITKAYLSLCELRELRHCKFHLTLLRTRWVWWCSLRLHVLQRGSWSCHYLWICRNGGSARHCCGNRLTSDYLGHYLLGLACMDISFVLLRSCSQHKKPLRKRIPRLLLPPIYQVPLTSKITGSIDQSCASMSLQSHEKNAA